MFSFKRRLAGCRVVGRARLVACSPFFANELGQFVGETDEVSAIWPRSRSRSAARRSPRCDRTRPVPPPFARLSVRTLGGAGETLLAKPLLGLVDVAAGRFEGALASIMPAPVALRRAWTSFAVKLGIAQLSSVVGAVSVVVEAAASGSAAGAGTASTGGEGTVSAAGGDSLTAGADAATSTGVGPPAGASLVAMAASGGVAGGSGVSDPTGALGPRGGRRWPDVAAVTGGAGGLGRLIGDPPPLVHSLGHDPAHQRPGADGVVVPRDHVGD